MSNQSSLQSVGQHLMGIVRPVQYIFSDSDAFKSYMSGMGWNIASLPAAYTRIANDVGGLIEKGETIFAPDYEPTVSDILSIIALVKNSYDDIQKISDAPKEAGSYSNEFISTITDELFTTLITDYIQFQYPYFHSILLALNIIEYQDIAATTYRDAYSKPVLNLAHIGDYFKDPLTNIKDALGWGTADLNFDNILLLINGLAYLMNLDALVDLQDPAKDDDFLNGLTAKNISLADYIGVDLFKGDVSSVYTAIRLLLQQVTPDNSALPGIILRPDINLSSGTTLTINDNLSLTISADFDLSKLFSLIISPDTVDYIYPDSISASPPNAELGLTLNNTYQTPNLIFGDPNASRILFTSGNIGASLGYANNSTYFIITAALNDLDIVLSAGDGDSFISKILGDGEKHIKLNFGVQWSSVDGFKVTGAVGGGLQKTINSDLSLGPIQIKTIDVGVNIPTDNSGITAYAAPAISGALGILTFQVQGLGVQTKLNFSEGNLGPYDLTLGFKPPTGIGLQVDGDTVQGGGFLSIDVDNGRYSGALDLTFEKFALSALGLLDTRLPGGKSGYSFLGLISLAFTPAIQLGFGFTLDKLGGLIGLHRIMDVDAARGDLRSGDFTRAMFTDNPAQNAPTILSALNKYYPTQNDTFIFGPMGRINWGTPALISLELGLFMQLKPNGIKIAGLLKSFLPTAEDALLKLQVAFLGDIDFEKRFLKFDASIFDSKLLSFSLSGDMAVRLFWGKGGGFLISVGGFHPSYQVPTEMQLGRQLQRLTISIIDEDELSLRTEAYFAVTSNTVQFGTDTKFRAGFSKFEAKADLKFDALIYYRPRFRFEADIEGSVEISIAGDTLAGIHLSLQLQGPARWNANGKGEFDFLCISYDVNVSKEWGEQQPSVSIAKTDVYALFKEAILKQESWQVTSPPNKKLSGGVKLRTLSATDLVLGPSDVLKLNQKLIPLNVKLNKFGESDIDISKTGNSDQKYDITQLSFSVNGTEITVPATELRESFSPGQFFTLSTGGGDAKAQAFLARPSFEDYKSGLSIGFLSEAQMLDGDAYFRFMRRKTLAPQVVLVDSVTTDAQASQTENATDFLRMLRSNSASQSSLAPESVAPRAYQQVNTAGTAKAQYGLAYSSDLSRYAPDQSFISDNEARQYLQEVIGADASLQNKIIALPLYELAA
jgi:hypothetical protein